MPSRIEFMNKLRGTDTIGFNMNPIDIIIKPRELAVNATAKKVKNKETKGIPQMSTCFHSVMEKIFGMNFSSMRDCLFANNRIILIREEQSPEIWLDASKPFGLTPNSRRIRQLRQSCISDSVIVSKNLIQWLYSFSC